MQTRLEDVLGRRIANTSWRRLEDVFKRSWKKKNVTLKTSSRCLEDVLENKKCLLSRTPLVAASVVFWIRINMFYSCSGSRFLYFKVYSRDVFGTPSNIYGRSFCLSGSEYASVHNYFVINCNFYIIFLFNNDSLNNYENPYCWCDLLIKELFSTLLIFQNNAKLVYKSNW